MIRAFALPALIALAQASPSPAQDSRYSMRTGNDVYAVCANRDATDRTMCLSWVAGFIAGLTTVQAFGQRRTVCLRGGMTNGQYLDIIVTFMDENPGRRRFAAGIVALDALYRAFPCRRVSN
ncbi:MAG TPA: Rap1a/Tai family immunity protein [Allosphingosinicella sp.]